MDRNIPGLNVTESEMAAIEARVNAARADEKWTNHLWVEECFPRRLPPGWRVLQRDLRAGLNAQHWDGMTVIMTGSLEADGRKWIHLSLARAKRLPSWNDIKLVKEAFLGPDRAAIQVFPKVEQYVNIHPFCLHLWHCVDGDQLPDFTRGTGSI